MVLLVINLLLALDKFIKIKSIFSLIDRAVSKHQIFVVNIVTHRAGSIIGTDFLLFDSELALFVVIIILDFFDSFIYSRCRKNRMPRNGLRLNRMNRNNKPSHHHSQNKNSCYTFSISIHGKIASVLYVFKCPHHNNVFVLQFFKK
jgi:hypothetical protein